MGMEVPLLFFSAFKKAELEIQMSAKKLSGA
jgi:hypothetical protein